MYKIMTLFILMIFSSQGWTQTLEEDREQVEKNINSAEEMISSLKGDFKSIRKRFFYMQKAISILDSRENLRSTIIKPKIAKLKEIMTTLNEKLKSMDKTIVELEKKLENTGQIIWSSSGLQTDDYKDKMNELAIKRTNLAALHTYYLTGYEKMEEDILKLEEKYSWCKDRYLDFIDFVTRKKQPAK